MDANPGPSDAPFDDSPGRVLGHYCIVEKIGAGGMGVVYRARDQRLDRDVALKILAPGILTDAAARGRFRHEALALSRSSHHNISTIFDFDTHDGVDFLVMEYLQGLSLARKLQGGALAEAEVRNLGMQLAQGLAAAHESGIIHRDIKPANIFIARDGRAKILDFGVSRRERQHAGPDTPTETVGAHAGQTSSSSTGGTLAYMAPEQLRGEPGDARTDVYAAGMVLYEMAVGNHPFAGAESFELAGLIFHETPKFPSSVKISPQLQRVIQKALEKDPLRRQQSAVDLHSELERMPVRADGSALVRRTKKWVAASLFLVALAAAIAWSYRHHSGDAKGANKPAVIESIAVLPLDNLSGNSEQDYFADGMTEALIADFAKIRALRVTSRTSVMRYKGTKKTLPEIASELNVDAIVAGSVARSENKIRITAELFDARSDRSLWGETYDRDLRDVLALQGEVARSVADQIRVQLTPHENEQLASGHVVNPQAYEAYLKGLYYWNKRTELGFQQAVEYLKRSIELDPNYAPAYAGLSNSKMALSYYEFKPVKEMMVDALPAARKAIELDNSLAESHTSRAMLAYIGEWDWTTTESEFQRALELDPRYPLAHHFYSDYLSAMGRHDEALAQEQQALQLEPQAPIVNTWIAKRYYQSRHYDEGLAAVQKALELEPNFTPALLQKGLLCAELQRYDEAIAALQKAVDISHGGLLYVAALGYARAAAGKKAEAHATLVQLLKLSKTQYVPSYYVATIYLALGENENAFKWLDRAFDEHSAWIVNLNVDPALDPLRKDPRFASLVRRVGLPKISRG